MRPVETIPEMGGEGIKENDGRENSTMIYCLMCLENVSYRIPYFFLLFSQIFHSGLLIHP
jgi:hypothetical protein